MKLMATAQESIAVDARRGGSGRQALDNATPDGAPHFDGVLADVGANDQGQVAADAAAKTPAATVAASATLTTDTGNTSMNGLLGGGAIKSPAQSPVAGVASARTTDIVFNGTAASDPSLSEALKGLLPQDQKAATTPAAAVSTELAAAVPPTSLAAAKAEDASGLVTSILKRLKGGKDDASATTSTGNVSATTTTSPDLMAMLMLGAGAAGAAATTPSTPSGQSSSSSAGAASTIGLPQISSDAAAAGVMPLSSPASAVQADVDKAVLVSNITIETHLAPVSARAVAANSSATDAVGGLPAGGSRQAALAATAVPDAGAPLPASRMNENVAVLASVPVVPSKGSAPSTNAKADGTKPTSKSEKPSAAQSAQPSVTISATSETGEAAPSLQIDAAANKQIAAADALSDRSDNARPDPVPTSQTAQSHGSGDTTSESALDGAPTIRVDSPGPSALSAMAPSTGLTNGPTRTLASAIVELASQPASTPLDTQKTSLAPARTMTLQMNPAQLGTIGIKLHLTGRTLDVELSVSSSETLGIISRERDTLSSTLQDQSYQLNSLVIQDGGAGASSGGNNGTQHGDTFGGNAAPGRQDSSGTFSQDGDGRRESSAGQSGRNPSSAPRTPQPRAASGAAGDALFV